MHFALKLERLFKRTFLLCCMAMAVLFFYKDTFPEPGFYGEKFLEEPVQSETVREEFTASVNGQEYRITPLYEYELQGVVVSYHDADSFLDIWHHKRWLDFLNQRDLCVIWGDNLESGVYQKMQFSNDSWTCWAYWPDSATGSRFKMYALSNNHILVEDERLASKLMAAEVGDQIRLKGLLATYANKSNGFKRGTSTIREDSGNGACETVYLTDFEVVRKANSRLRGYYSFAQTIAGFSLAGFLVLFFITPFRIN